MESRPASETLEQVADRIFQAHQGISYLAIMDQNLTTIVQKGFLDFHPSKLKKFHIQTSLVIKVCTVSSELFGGLDHVTASFTSTNKVMVVPLSTRLHLVVVAPNGTEETLQQVKRDIISNFKPP
jgi:hypothetical protein